MTESSPISGALNAPDNAAATAMQPVAKVRPAAGYIGGKRNLARRLTSRIASVPHHTYAEVFVGMGGIFFRREARPPVEVINDWSEDVSTFFRILQRHYVAFQDMIRFQISSRAGFEKLKALDPASLTDLERSARFLYLQKLAYGGLVSTRRFGVDPGNSGRFDVSKLGPQLESLHERLAGVTIERLHWRDFLTRYDRTGTLFYLDPPYYGNEGDYGTGLFNREDFAELAARLATVKGRFILSINDRPEVRDIFARFAFDEVETTYSLAPKDRAKRVPELIISNT
jgi:DNA adenine methylase